MGALNCQPSTIPTFKNYLKPDNSHISDSLDSLFSNKKRIGVCWSGHPQRPYDARRSIPFDIVNIPRQSRGL